MSRKDELDGLVQQIDKELAKLDEVDEGQLDQLSLGRWGLVVKWAVDAKTKIALSLKMASPPEVVPTEQLEEEFGL